MRKGALKVTLAIRPNVRLNVWNVHLQNGVSTRVRSRQVTELVRWIEAAHDGQIADIVGGDFNFTPGSEEFGRFVSAVGFSAHQLAAVMPLPTWDGLQPARHPGQVLDHIFVKTKGVTEDIAAQAQRLFCASLLKDRLSDHMGVEVNLTLRESEANRPPAPAWKQPLPVLAAAAVIQ